MTLRLFVLASALALGTAAPSTPRELVDHNTVPFKDNRHHAARSDGNAHARHSSEDGALSSAFINAEAELFAHDMARLDAMFATHNLRTYRRMPYIGPILRELQINQ